MGPRHGGRGELAGLVSGAGDLLLASMGPRHGGRGERQRFRYRRLPVPGFNGATTRRPWRTVLGSDRSRAALTGFNGATTRRPWRTASRQVEITLGAIASMGPRHGGRG